MILGGNQPYFIPYIGYWQLINSVDVFKISDDYNYIKHGWISKNRILVNGKPSDFRIELSKASSNKLITDIELGEISVKNKLKALMFAYGKAPYYENGIELMKEIFDCDDKNLADYLTNSIKVVCNYLDINTKIIRTSDFEGNSNFKREYRIFDLCERIGATEYHNAIGGQALYTYEQFREHGIELGFIKTGDIKYKQFNNEFVPNLSILDVIMFNSKDEIKDMLNDYTVLKEDSK